MLMVSVALFWSSCVIDDRFHFDWIYFNFIKADDLPKKIHSFLKE